MKNREDSKFNNCIFACDLTGFLTKMIEDEACNMIEQRLELMIPPNSGSSPTLREAHFLKPISNSTNQSFPNFLSSKQPLNPNIINKRVKFRGMLKPLNSWKSWVDNLQQNYEEIWKKAGIFNAIKSSTYHIIQDNKLIIELAEKWCSETNTFVFPWGECTVTLEDVMILGGFSVLGNSARSQFRITENGDLMKILVESKKKLHKKYNLCYVRQEKWLNYFMGRGGEVEHVAFLVLWLSRYVFQSNSLKGINVIHLTVFSTAISIARGTRIAFAPAILASIYRDLRLLKEKIVDCMSGDTYDGSMLVVRAPFLLVHVWAWERFPGLSPRPCSLACGEPRVARWHGVKGLKCGDLRVGIESVGDDFLWRPYALGLQNWEFPRFYCDQEKWVVVVCEDEQILSFAKCLMSCDLVGLNCVERYLPQRVAMQFGLDQDLPLYVPRLSIVSEFAWNSYDKPLDGLKLYLPHRLSEGDVSLMYSEWWRAPVFVGDHEFLKRKRSTRKLRKVSKIVDQDQERNGSKAGGLDSVCDNREMANENSSFCDANGLDATVMSLQVVVAEVSDKCENNAIEVDEGGKMNCDNENICNQIDHIGTSSSDMLMEFSPPCEKIASQNDGNVANDNPNDMLINPATQPKNDRENPESNALVEEQIEDEHGKGSEDVKLKQVQSSFDDPVNISDEDDSEVEAVMAKYLAMDIKISRLERIVSVLKEQDKKNLDKV